ncbi:glycosyltransferase family 2 protein [Cognatitamlana onchidii]|uniref:glycosyltransferase family 2 protein n=1 Tax=Cognatitamlana onchidii TaxID=2562860 RepID=UPI0010A636E6|nr:glycosyltransferase family 2 protein [Algibacter onchidii]
MNIAIVILNWNGEKLLKQFLPTVIENSPEAKIYIADNASTDNSVDFVKNNFPSISIIKNNENGGYAKGYNDALKHIEADVFCLLNNDVEVSKNWLLPILKTFTSRQDVGIMQPKLLDYNKRNHFEYAGAAGGFIDKFGYPYCRGRIFNTIEKDIGQYNDTTEIFWASGACLFIRSSIYKELKGLDQHFFAHIEEIDLCWRAKNLGYKVVYNSASVIYHLGGATLSNTNPRKTFLNFRNSLFALVKNAKQPISGLICFRLLLDGIAGIKFLLELKPQHTFAIVKAHLSFYKHFSRLIKQRKSLKQTIKYYQKTSIVFDYFVNKKTNFKSL